MGEVRLIKIISGGNLTNVEDEVNEFIRNVLPPYWCELSNISEIVFQDSVCTTVMIKVME